MTVRVNPVLYLSVVAAVGNLAGCERSGRGGGGAAAADAPPAETRSAEAVHTNRLINETSPYLLQHAHNPVDWYAWGPEAFEAARAAGKPIFLSIGYSTCYWCHVMERESFENVAIAALMNEHFVSIKVDREERPDVDDIYMAATQIFNQGGGGWPMSVFLEPQNLKPFLAGTYFPPEDRPQRLGFASLLKRVAEGWASQREGIMRQADQLAGLVVQQLSLDARPQPVGEQQVEQAITMLLDIYDEQDAGFGRGGNKFPMPVYLDLLVGAAWQRDDGRNAVLHTLDRMALGGMYDQIGGGFHRYSTDSRWLVPHFEKMLYDNGQLASTYAAAYELTGDAFYAEIVRETLEYVLREMTDGTGAFFSAQDAEVNAREGGNYIWVADEVRAALTDAGLTDDIDFALDVYGFDRGPNFQDPHHPEDGPKNVVFLLDRPDRLAAERGLSPELFNQRLIRINAALLTVRDRRDQPGTDDKILAGWNGLMIGGMADGGRVLQEPRYLEAGRRAAEFVLTSMRDDEGGLLRTFRSEQAKVAAFLEDYALVIRGLVALYRATGESRWLEAARELADGARQRFWDDGAGAYYDTLRDQDDLFVRTKSTYDGAVPCGNSIMLIDLLDLHELTGADALLDDAAATLEGLSSAVAARPVATALATLGLARIADGYPRRLTAPPTTAPAAGPRAVEVEASAERVEVSAESPGSLELTLRIADGYHINAHDPGPANLIGLSVKVVGSGGVTVRPDYQAGELYRGEIRVLRGTVTLPVSIEGAGAVTGEPKLAVTYQVCTDRVCLAPTTEILPIEIVAN
ncbi:MAG: DUF255 domain-containing protein [Planctomycetota bacterium]